LKRENRSATSSRNNAV